MANWVKIRIKSNKGTDYFRYAILTDKIDDRGIQYTIAEDRRGNIYKFIGNMSMYQGDKLWRLDK